MSEWKLTSTKPAVKSTISSKKTTKSKRAGLGGTKKVANVNFEKLEKESTVNFANNNKLLSFSETYLYADYLFLFL